ncbi:hypothetical protein QVD17_06801 [Tagetes erecta]|uniref:Uncharacterized protein n=1 Tax=Tagetes erecta TaxID=13708 RepID=A0AAD8LLC9_TARER|nr:hypothetical protein QVD17_06801 [Tagetes erecta]
MGCGISRSHLYDEGVTAVSSRSPFHHHHKTTTPPPKLLIDSPIVHHPPVLQKIKTVGANHRIYNDDIGRSLSNSESGSMWFGSPSFRVYVQSAPDGNAKTGDEMGKGNVVEPPSSSPSSTTVTNPPLAPPSLPHPPLPHTSTAATSTVANTRTSHLNPLDDHLVHQNPLVTVTDVSSVRQVCVWGDSNENELAERKDVRGGRFRKVFQVHRVAFWHGGPWHVGHVKETREAA